MCVFVVACLSMCVFCPLVFLVYCFFPSGCGDVVVCLVACVCACFIACLMPCCLFDCLLGYLLVCVFGRLVVCGYLPACLLVCCFVGSLIV